MSELIAETTQFGALNIYIPYYGYITQCYEGFWSAGKHEDGPLWHSSIEPALEDMGMSGMRLSFWTDFLRKRIDKAA